MEEYKYKNPYSTLIMPATGILILLFFRPQINTVPWIGILPVSLIIGGAFLFYRKFIFRIVMDDSAIKIGEKKIPWNKIEKGVITKQLIKSGNRTTFITGISLLYLDNENNRKAVSIIPKYINKPVAVTNSIKKRIELVPLDKLR